MDGDSQGRNGRSYSEEKEVTVNGRGGGWDKRLEYAKAGFQVPRPNTVLDGSRFWRLVAEGWRFVVGQDGVILACLPPMLNARLDAMTDIDNAVRKQRENRNARR